MIPIRLQNPINRAITNDPYDGEIAYTDSVVGKLISSALKRVDLSTAP